MSGDLAKLARLIEDYQYVTSINRLAHYAPYPFQVSFHNAEGYMTPGEPAAQKLLCGGNKIGKTLCGAMDVAIHATGRYPDWWKGHRFLYAPEILVCGLTNESVRDLCQRELFGDPMDDKSLGTGTIPKDCIVKHRGKAGVPNAYDNVRVKHVGGFNSRVYMRAYEQGWKKFQGIAFEVVWADEEPAVEIWSQLLRATTAKRRAVISCTMTPEEGYTEVVANFFNDIKKGQALVGGTWDDAKHMTDSVKEQRRAALRPHEREMREKGIPLQGAGLIFQVPDSQIVVKPREIPNHWARINGLDFGFDHPFAACQLAWDRDTDCVYLIAEYKESRALPAVHSQAVSKWGDWIPVAWPHDGLNTEKGTGDELTRSYRDCKLNLLPWRATNPPLPGQKEGEGGNSVESSLLEMQERMETGRFKVFDTCTEWLKEKRMYHRDVRAKIVKVGDDLIDASRYGVMMLRHARTRSVMPRRSTAGRTGMSNWGARANG